MVKDGVDGTMVEGMKEPYNIPMRLSVHHPRLNVPVLWWRSVGSTHTAYVMETLIDEIARSTGQDPVAYRLKQFGTKHPRHTAALQLAVAKSGYGKRTPASGRAWGVAVHESFNTVVAYVVEASVKDNTPVLHSITAGVHCNLAINPTGIEAQIQGGALMGLSMCLPGAAITLKDGVVEQSNFGDFPVPRITDMPTVAVFIVPSADAPTGLGEPGLPPLAPAFANAIARLTGKPAPLSCLSSWRDGARRPHGAGAGLGPGRALHRVRRQHAQAAGAAGGQAGVAAHAGCRSRQRAALAS